MIETSVIPAFVNRASFIELNGRDRAQALFDQGSWRELVGPFDRVESPWLPMQGVTPQADDGCIVIKGEIGGNRRSPFPSKVLSKAAVSAKSPERR